MNWSGHFIRSHRDRQPCPRHALLKMDGSEASPGELLAQRLMDNWHGALKMKG